MSTIKIIEAIDGTEYRIAEMETPQFGLHFNLQEWTPWEDGHIYSGYGHFTATIEEAEAYAKNREAQKLQDFTSEVFSQSTETDYEGNLLYYSPDGEFSVTYPKEDMIAYCESKGIEYEDIDANDYEELENSELMELVSELYAKCHQSR